MPIIRRVNVQSEEFLPGLLRLKLINAEFGAGHLDVGEIAIAPNQKVPLHVHHTHEEGMYVLDGPMNYVIGNESGVAQEGDMILAPAGVKHELSNPGDKPIRVMYIFPTTNVQREFL